MAEEAQRGGECADERNDNDDAYAREYFLQPGSQNPAGIALDAFAAVMPCVWYPEMKCSAEFVARTLQRHAEDARYSSTGRRSSEKAAAPVGGTPRKKPTSGRGCRTVIGRSRARSGEA